MAAAVVSTGAAAQTTPAKADAAPPASSAKAPPATPAAVQYFDIDEYRVDGADNLQQIEVEEAVYPFLGPHRSSQDVEKARAALEKSYHDKGYQTVTVSVPAQNVDTHVVILKVTEGKVGVLRVKNSRYFDLAKIKEKAPSLKEGTLPNFDDVKRDIVALNQWPDRRVTPALRAGETPGTVDVDLNVEDTLPLHGSVELNNRQSPNTTPLRIYSTIHYDNLWQLGHSFSVSYQIAPDRPADAQVFSASYLARITDNLSFLTYGLDSKSDVATVGGLNVVGPGQVVGGRAVITLPGLGDLFHTISMGVDYKHFGQTVGLGASAFSSPVTYFPAVANYSATWQQQGALTQLNAGATLNLRGPGSGFSEFDNKRAYANTSFIHGNADLSRTQDLPMGFQIYGKVQGQLADGPLVSSEQFSLGGLDTVRGYLESETLGDNGVAGRLELRSPDLASLQKAQNATEGQQRPNVFNEWRMFGFADGGIAEIDHPLPQQQPNFSLASYGVGTNFKAVDHLNGSVVLAFPLVSQTYTRANEPRVLFRVWGEF
jgi:hemolysin activation/secretion protein